VKGALYVLRRQVAALQLVPSAATGTTETTYLVTSSDREAATGIAEVSHSVTNIDQAAAAIGNNDAMTADATTLPSSSNSGTDTNNDKRITIIRIRS
jgi:hypothetical protein